MQNTILNKRAEDIPHMNEVEMELEKMKEVTRDIRIVLDNILQSKNIDKHVRSTLIRDF